MILGIQEITADTLTVRMKKMVKYTLAIQNEDSRAHPKEVVYGVIANDQAIAYREDAFIKENIGVGGYIR